MEEIKVGEYVRTVDGIRKIVKINTGKGKTIFGTYILDKKYKGSFSIAEKNILKHSFNIIDLIEVGDFVNGFKVNGKASFSNGTGKVQVNSFTYDFDKPKGKALVIESEFIKSIVTKEQFESMEYKVGD